MHQQILKHGSTFCKSRLLAECREDGLLVAKELVLDDRTCEPVANGQFLRVPNKKIVMRL